MLLWSGLILVGFVAGYFFAYPVLVFLTVACVFIDGWLYWEHRDGGLESLIMPLFITCSTISLIAMWVTHYYVSGYTWFGEFLSGHVLR